MFLPASPTKQIEVQNAPKRPRRYFWLTSHRPRHPLTLLTPRAPLPGTCDERVVNTVTSDDLPPSSGVKRPMLPFSSPDPKAKSKMARQDGGGDDGARLSPTSVQSPPDLVRAVYSARKNAGQK